VLSGGNYFITKPVDPLELALKVTIHLFKAQVQHAGAPQPETKPEVKPQAAKAPEVAPKPPVPAPPANQQMNGSMNGKAKNGEPTSAAPPKAQPRPATMPEAAPKPAPPVLKSAPPVPINLSRNGRGNSTPAVPALSVAPPVAPLNIAPPVKPRATNFSKVMAPLSVAPSLGETGTLNVSKLSGSRNRNRIMNNEQDEAFEKVVVAVVRIIFGDDNLTEMNVRLVRIALERYNVHEVINSPVVA
jgi:hypothetical protein